MTTRRRVLASAVGLPLITLGSCPRAQSEFPNKPIKIVCLTVPGGAADIAARLIAERLREILGVTVLVENQTGATGNIGLQTVARAQPDGYTLVFPSAAATANLASRPKQAFDLVNELRPVGKVGLAALSLVVPPNINVKSVEQFIEFAKGRNDIAYGSIGHGSSQHLVMEMMCSMTGLNMIHTPYKGEGAVVNDITSGRLHAMFMIGAKPLIESGKVVGLATTHRTRWPTLPNLRPIGEIPALKGFWYNGWVGLMAPKGTPDEIIQKLGAATARSLEDERMRSGLRAAGYEPGLGNPAEMGEQLAWDVNNFRTIIAERKLVFPE